MIATYIEVIADVRYWEDATINGITDDDGKLTPLKRGDSWCPVIRLEDGLVVDWPTGTIANIHFQVCDAGEYWLLDEAQKRIAKWGGFYVPNDFLCPGTHGWGDYIIMKIDDKGFVQKWKRPIIEWACDCDKEDRQYTWKKLKQEAGAT